MISPDPVLQKFRAALDELYGDRIERVVLYGSRARGDALPDSDYDVALFLKDLTDSWQEVRRIVAVQLAIRDDTDTEIHTLPFPAVRWRDHTPLMHEIRKDGLDL
jgi:uncharacterized protein